MDIHSVRAAVAGLGVSLLLAGCAISPLAKRTAAFSTAATAAAKGTTDAFDLVEQAHYNTEVEEMVADYDSKGFHPELFQPFMPQADMDTRTKILKGLTQYAVTLAAVAGDQAVKEMDTQAEATGESLLSISKSDGLKAYLRSAHITTVDVNGAATAVDALGRALIERKRGKELPAILKEMKDPVDQICKMLEADIGAPEESGLRNQLHNDYETLLEKEQKFIKENPTMGAGDKRAAVEALAAALKDEAAGDKTLAATETTLEQLAKTYDALVDTASAKDSPVFRSMVSDLSSDGDQLQSFYAKLSAAKLPTK